MSLNLNAIRPLVERYKIATAGQQMQLALAVAEQSPVLLAKVDELTAAQDRAAKRIDALRDYILGALDEHDTLAPDEMRNASIDLADALADLGHPVADEPVKAEAVAR